ncbi:MAG: glycine C-acetyltransferase [Candidatus Lernaella stagnicola]|nr:glycine C-acetyltransferase [Candidatus Lernaella stagnicola]
MYGKMKEQLQQTLQSIRDDGLFKTEWPILGSQAAEIEVAQGKVLNFCANNYLGLANHPALVAAAKGTLAKYGFGMSSVRFICGTLDLHRELEQRLAAWLGFDDAVLYSSCFDANGGLFETLLTADDAIISDQLNHASIIDGVRLCKAERHRYANGNMDELEKILQATQGKRFRLVATDGVFSMDGYIAKLDQICDLADKYDALVMVDDSHATGFLGKTGKGSIEYKNVLGRIDIVTSTLGKAMGGASGGFTCAHQEIIDLLRQRSRPYLFSNTLAPVIAGTTLAVLDMLEASTELRDKLEDNTRYFREQMSALGFDILPSEHPIVAVMFYDAKLSQDFANQMLDEGIYVKGFFYPVVPKEKARIRVQISAGHDREHLDRAIAAFAKVGRNLGVVS